MIRPAAAYPETLRPADPLARAACAPYDPELWFPKNRTAPETAKTVKAKQICGRCPVRTECLTRALDQNEQHGIFGGLDEDERRTLRREATEQADGERDEPSPSPTRKARTLSELYAQRTTRLPGGHVDWNGCTSVTFQGDNYTPRQIAFILDRDYRPTGTVKTTCDHEGCIQALHLTDAEERGRCGTQTGYRRHLARGESCEKCRAANAAADRRLRETGTTKVLAS